MQAIGGLLALGVLTSLGWVVVVVVALVVVGLGYAIGWLFRWISPLRFLLYLGVIAYPLAGIYLLASFVQVAVVLFSSSHEAPVLKGFTDTVTPWLLLLCFLVGCGFPAHNRREKRLQLTRGLDGTTAVG